MKYTCPLCQRRRARRACPALGQQICPVCCGTKRLVEISCPADCSYLQSANTHPPAIVQRQQEKDVRFLLPLMHDLSERQRQIMVSLQTFLRTDRPDAPAVTDVEIEEAAKALAETYETASRGILYEHTATSLNAQRLSKELKAVIESEARGGVRMLDADIAIATRRIETAAHDARHTLIGGEIAYLSLLKRVLREPKGEATRPSDPGQLRQTSSGLIVPGR